MAEFGTAAGGGVLVTGATGSTGSALVDELTRRDVPVRVMVRQAADADRFVGAGAGTGAGTRTGTSVVVADFDDASALAAALTGIERAYLVTPSSALAAERQIRFAEIAAKAGVEQLVVLSQLAADESSPVRFLRWHAEVEQRIQRLGIGYTFLRPNLFFQGLLAFAGSITATGQFFAPIGTAAVSAVDVRDIAAVAAVTLTEPGHLGMTYDITGPKAVSHFEMASALSTATGREITFADASPEEFARALTGMLPEWQLDGLLEDYAHYRRGEAAVVSSAVERITGVQPRGVDEFARDYAAAFEKRSSDRTQAESGGQ